MFEDEESEYYVDESSRDSAGVRYGKRAEIGIFQDEVHVQGGDEAYRGTLSRETVEFGKVIGKGAFGKVVQGYVAGNPHDVVAVKCISRRKIDEHKLQKQLATEVTVHSNLVHPNIIGFLDFAVDNKKVYIFLEYAQYGDLLSYVSKLKPTEVEFATLLYYIGRGIEFFHNYGIVHRDIKPENVLVDGNGIPKITDFGYCDKIGTNGYCTNELFCGTDDYMAPEIVLEKKYSYPGDIWSYGVMVFDLLVGEPPFQSDTRVETYQKIKECAPDLTQKALRGAKYMLRSIFVKNPKMRPTMTEILEDEWFAS